MYVLCNSKFLSKVLKTKTLNLWSKQRDQVNLQLAISIEKIGKAIMIQERDQQSQTKFWQEIKQN